jgi:hypothetical protein
MVTTLPIAEVAWCEGLCWLGYARVGDEGILFGARIMGDGQLALGGGGHAGLEVGGVG